MSHPAILSNRAPRLAEVQCSRLQFQPGDRVIVRTMHRLTSEEQKKLRRTIVKFAGCEIEVLIYCMADMEITVEKR